MVAGQAVITQQSPSTTVERPCLHKGQVENQDQIKEKDVLVIHYPNGVSQRIEVIRGPLKCGGSLCIKVQYMGGRKGIICLADLSVVRYMNGTWNLDNWLGKY
jgi:hypothetical protein